MPKCLSAKSGVQVVSPKNSPSETLPKNSYVSNASTNRMPAVTRIDSAPQPNSAPSMTRSRKGVARRGDPFRARSRWIARATTVVTSGGLLCEELLDRDADLRAVERRAGLPVGEPLAGQLVGVRRQRDVADLLHQLRPLGQVVLDVRLHLGPVHLLARHVDEDRARQRLVGAVLDRLRARRDRPLAVVVLAVVDRDQLQLVLVLGVVGVAEEGEAALVGRHALDEHVVVLARREVTTARVLLAHHRLREVVVRAAVDAGAEE